MKTYFSRLHYDKSPGILNRLVILLLLPVSVFYSLVVGFRNFLYDKGLIKIKKLPVFVISVGNLTTGGTGKTPITAKIAEYLNLDFKKNIAVISRGYGGKLDINSSNIISDGKEIFFNAEKAGDEPFWIAKNSENTIVITGKNRFKSGKLAIENFNSEIILLDDGFQHRKLVRDLDILLIDCDKAFGNGFLLPAGPLRESVSQLKRADKVIIVNKSPCLTFYEEKVNSLKRILKEKYRKESYICEFTPEEIYDISTQKPVANIKKAIAFSGIAQPESFFSFLRGMHIELAAQKAFSDHYMYKPQDIQQLFHEARTLGADALITTEKDSVKIQAILEKLKIQIPVCALKLKANLDVNELLQDISENLEIKKR